MPRRACRNIPTAAANSCSHNEAGGILRPVQPGPELIFNQPKKSLPTPVFTEPAGLHQFLKRINLIISRRLAAAVGLPTHGLSCFFLSGRSLAGGCFGGAFRLSCPGGGGSTASGFGAGGAHFGTFGGCGSRSRHDGRGRRGSSCGYFRRAWGPGLGAAHLAVGVPFTHGGGLIGHHATATPKLHRRAGSHRKTRPTGSSGGTSTTAKTASGWR